MDKVELLYDPKFWAQIEYEERGRPADTVESSLEIPTIWLVDELEDAKVRDDFNAISNLSEAARVRLQTANSRMERITFFAVHRNSTDYIEQAGQQG